jgi:subtilisin-like proprotein convertase family protein
MPAINYSFPIEQGSDFSISFQYNDENGLPINLAESACVIFQIKNTTTADPPIISGTKVLSTATANTNPAGFSISASDAGLITLSIDRATTQTLNYENAVYDLDVIKDGKSLRLAYGNITIDKRQTDFADCVPSAGGGGSTGGGGGTTTTPDVPVSDASDLCLDTDCLNLDIYSIVYSGMPIYVGAGGTGNDLSISSGSIITYDTRGIENIELVINNLNHNSPQDLQMFLCPPSGNKILLAANHKIPQNSGNFNFMFSNKAPVDKYLHNVTNGGLCNIYNKTSIINYSNESLSSSFNHLCSGISITGTWNLLIRDTDPISSGSIDGWKLIVTYIQVQ